MKNTTIGLSALALAIASSGIAAQDSGLREVIVTAAKRNQDLQEVPIAVNAFTSQVIQEAGINDVQDIARMTPSAHATTDRSPFQTRLAIRGIGTAQNDPALEPSVGIFVDGMFLGRTGLGTSDLTDIERIEVLQGPQGTLYGKNTNAGAISVITKKPNLEETEGYAQFSTGDYGMRKVTLTATGPLSETVAYRLSGNSHQHDGYYDNANGSDPSDADDWNVQGKLLWEPSAELSVVLNASHVERDSAGGGFDIMPSAGVQAELASQGLPAADTDPYNHNIATDSDGLFEMESDNLSLHVTYDLDWGRVTSLTAWNDYEFLTNTDVDGSQLDLLGTAMPEPNSGDSLSQEIRLDSTLSDTIDYQVGLYYYDQKTQRGADGYVGTVIGEDFVTLAGPGYLGALATFGAQQIPLLGFAAKPGDSIGGKNVWDSETLAAFGQMTWRASDRLAVTAGLRWTDEERVADLLTITTSTPLTPMEQAQLQQISAALQQNPNLPAKNKGVVLNLISTPFIDRFATEIDATLERRSINKDWLMKVAYDLDDNSMVYASASTGTKSGNFNGVNGPAISREFDDEKTRSYELGIKSTLLDSTLRINAAAFVTEVDNLQFQSQLADAGTAVSNAAMAKVAGVDISLQAKPLNNLTLEAGVLYMDKYENIRPALEEGDVEEITDLFFVADWSGNLAATFVIPVEQGAVYMRGDYIYRGEHDLVNGRDDRKELNARIGWRNDNWNLSIWGKNLTDDEYASMINDVQKWSGNQPHLLAPPRTYGVDVRYNF